jgi:ComF family protein
MRSYAEYCGPMRKAILRLKYSGDISMADILGDLLIKLLSNFDWVLDIIVPVPAGATHFTERGYNQAALLAMPVAWKSQVKYLPQALKKVRDTPSQVGLTVIQRRQNVTDAFEAREELVNRKRVLLVDDVTTSGATIEACSDALIKAGAHAVNAITLARATFAQHSDAEMNEIGSAMN